MNNSEPGIIGKQVNDMYGSRVGKAIGTATDIDGTVITVGVDCGYRGLMKISFEHLVVQEDSIVYVPQWRLDSQRILREKSLLIRRLRALHIILSENDRMKEDSEIVRHGYEEKLSAINESEYTVRETLSARLSDLNEQMKIAKSLRFDATIQYKSSEIPESDYKVVKAGTDEILERIQYEIDEIQNMERRLEDLVNEDSHIYDSVDVVESATEPEAATEATPEPVTIPPEPVTIPPEPVTIPPEPPTTEYSAPEPLPEAPTDIPAEPPKSDWLARMTSQ